jgi:hypothetical protein
VVDTELADQVLLTVDQVVQVAVEEMLEMVELQFQHLHHKEILEGLVLLVLPAP